MKNKNKLANWDEFCNIFGITPRNRILEFFLEGRELDFSIGDIVAVTKLNRATTYNTISELIKEDFVIESRKSANAQLYKININKGEVNLLMRIFNLILNNIVNKEVSTVREEENKEFRLYHIDTSELSRKNIKEVIFYLDSFLHEFSERLEKPLLEIPKTREEKFK